MKTERIFDLNAYITTKEVTVIESVKSNRKGYENCFEVITDSTIFSPEGGGQNADRGFFDDVRVVDVQEFDGELIHFLEKSFTVGQKVTEKIDFELRLRRMQNHDAEHLLCGLIHTRFGYNNVGFHITETEDENGFVTMETTMDVDGPLSAKDLADIEKHANRIIAENVRVYALLPSAEEAKNMVYRSKMEISEGLRLVVIEGYDVCACCAPCLRATGEMQVVKILDAMPHRGGMRLNIVAGIDAIKDYSMLHGEIKDMMKILSAKRDECGKTLEAHEEKALEMHETIVTLKKEITSLYKDNLLRVIDESENKYIAFFADTLDEVQARTLINETIETKECVLIVLFDKKDDGYRFVAGKNAKLTDVSLKELAVKMREGLAARGGGSEQMIQGSINSDRKSIEHFF